MTLSSKGLGELLLQIYEGVAERIPRGRKSYRWNRPETGINDLGIGMMESIRTGIVR